MEELNYEQDVKISSDDLDIECLEQPTLMLKYCRNEAEKEKEFDLKKTELDLVKSELDKHIRENPEKFDITVKLTEAVITNTIISNKQYKRIYHDYIDAKFEYNVAKGAVKAVTSRDKQLDNLTRLHGQQYFAGPSTPRDLSKEYEKRKARTNAKISDKINKRTRRK